MEYSSGLLKPDCLERNLVDEVLAAIREAGLEIVAVKRVRLTQKEIDVIYESCVCEDFYGDMSVCYCAGDCIFYIVKGANAIDRLNDVIGNREPAVADAYTIRHRFGQDVRRNVIHGTDNKKTFWKEVKLFFSREELGRILGSWAMN